MDLLLLLIALVVILFGAELFTNGIEWVGHKLDLAEGAVGSVLAAVGTALPETMIPIVAILFSATNAADQAATDAALRATAERARAAHGVDPAALATAVRRCAGELWRAGPAIAYGRAIGISSWEGLWRRFASHPAHTREDSRLRALRDWAPAYLRGAWSRTTAPATVPHPSQFIAAGE